MTNHASFAPLIVSQFLKSATPGQINWYLTRGEPQCLTGTFLKDGDFVEKLYPGLRGVIVGPEVNNPEAAIAKAQEMKEKFLAQELEAFDEQEHGIDDEARNLQIMFDQELLRLDEIFHVGTMQDGGINENLRDLLHDFDLEYPVAALDDLPFLRKALEQDEEDDVNAEDMIEMMRDHGTVGFLISASVPEREPHPNGSATIRYSRSRTNVFYASTFAGACRKAHKWAQEENARMQAKAA